ncbi:MAG: phosphoglycerate kinase [Elusimicrobia bacterium]|nr:phosphoglycerate kinase [Elusimicrobiota bacterium]
MIRRGLIHRIRDGQAKRSLAGKGVYCLMKLASFDVKNKKILLRVDFNVAIEGGRVMEPRRIEAAIPTIKWLIERRASLVAMSHLGRPQGWDKKYSLEPVARVLSEILRREKIPASVELWAKPFPGPELALRAGALKPNEILMLENLRFHPGEEKNDPILAKFLSGLGDMFVQEAFGAMHRAHASVDALARLMPQRTFGFLVEKELEVLGRLLSNAPKPFLVILGGLKVSDKISAIDHLLEKGVDRVLVGGALAYTFLKAKGVAVGKSPVEEDWVERVKPLVGQNGHGRLLIRKDHWIVRDVNNPAGARQTQDAAIAEEWEGVDVGPKTLEAFSKEIASAQTIFWNGPVGIIEVPPFERGSSEIARMIAARTKAGALTVLGGGDTIYALSKAGVSEAEFTHVSTGGGATIGFLEGKVLPGVAAMAGR